MIELLPKYPGYFATADGHIMSFKKPSKPIVLREQVHKKNGYHSVCLSINGVVKRVLVHRLIAYAHLGLDIDDQSVQVNHEDGNKGNNTPDNFVLMGNSGNHKHAFEVLGRRPTWLGKKGSAHCCARKYRVVHPGGGVQEITGLNEFCRQHDLRQSAMSKVIAGDLPDHRGFKIERINP